MKIDSYANLESASLIEKYHNFFYTKTMIDISFLVSTVFTSVWGSQILCLQLFRLKFELTNQDSAGEKISTALT